MVVSRTTTRRELLERCDQVRSVYHAWVDRDVLALAREWVEDCGVPVDPEWIDCLHGRGRLSAWLLSIDAPEGWQASLLAAAPFPRLDAIGYWYSWLARSLPVPIKCRSPRDPQARDAVREHLRRGEVWMSFAGFSRCRLCGREDETMGSCDLTDGVWVWPQGLTHYIEEHDIELPAAFLDHVASGQGIDEWRIEVFRRLEASVSYERWLAWGREVGAIKRSWLPRLRWPLTRSEGWYVTSYKTRGPFTDDQVRAMIRAGQIKPYHRLWKLGVGPERKARDMPGFIELCRTIPPERI
jgi:hypothetical protein